ncbi:glycosyltransferase [Chryseobacterium sp. NEB161]|nr:glycosyltransferase [Chryseobacterium sp. NEB161]
MNISVVIPVYNTELYLERCLNSLIAAQVEGLENEIILINDGSTDQSLDICNTFVEKYSNISVFTQINQGLSSARNFGISKANGLFISFVDSDDTVDLNYFSALKPFLISKNSVINFGYNRVQNNVKKSEHPFWNQEIITKEILDIAIVNSSKNNMLWLVWRRVYNREFLQNYNIKFAQELKYGEDSVFSLEVFKNVNEIINIDHCLYNYYDNENSLTTTRIKVDLLQKFELQYKKRIEVEREISVKRGIDLSKIHKNIADNYLNHALFILIINIKNSKCDKTLKLNNVRNSIIYKELFPYYKYDVNRIKRSIIIKLFQLRLFSLIFKLL